MSGRFAAETAADALAKNDCSRRNLAAYDRRWRREFPNYKVLLEGRRALLSLDAKQLDQMASLLPQELNSVGLGARVLLGLKLLAHLRLSAREAVTVLRALEYSRARYWGW
jgi:flavin-dependent dehydrogenase